MNPFSLDPSYAPELSSGELKQLEVQRSQELSFYVLCVVKTPVGNSTLNFRCPIAINEDTHTAMQVILDTDQYHMHHLLSEFGPKGADGSC